MCTQANSLLPSLSVQSQNSNMRTPAALIGGSIVPLGILSAPIVESNDNSRAILLKKTNMLLAIASLLNEVIAITYSSVAVNKIAELTFPPTEGVAQYIEQYHQLAWVGTNVHFLFGLFGFACLTISKPYLLYGKNIGDAAACWIVAAMAMCIAIVNRGISMGYGSARGEDLSLKFADNLFGLVVTYVQLLVEWSSGNILPWTSLGFILLSFVPIRRAWLATRSMEGERRRNNISSASMQRRTN
mmetsp:Transcript_18416/g.37074  ORF Transcript_18416/g.37074 Transcript_18416/m.37074 type:complete len:244 (-) Transcript_18416:41-772(-)